MSIWQEKSAHKEKKVKTNIAGKWCNLGRVVCESADMAMPNWRMKSKGPPWGRGQVLGVQTTPGFCLQPNIQLPVPTDVGISCKDYVNKVPHLEESVLLTRSERYFTETELAFFLPWLIFQLLWLQKEFHWMLPQYNSWVIKPGNTQAPPIRRQDSHANRLIHQRKASRLWKTCPFFL